MAGKTLIVEDDPYMVEMFKEQILDAELNMDDFIFAVNRVEAEKAISEESIDLLICDANIPKSGNTFARAENGLEVLRQAKEAGIERRWIISSNSKIQHEAVKDGLATFACAKIEAIERF